VAALKVTGLSIWVHVDLNPPFVVIGYTPTAQNAEPEVGVRLLTEYESQFKTSLYDLPSALQTKISRLGEYAVNRVDIPELDLGGTMGRGSVRPRSFQVTGPPRARRLLIVTFAVSGGLSSKEVPISEATERLIQNMWPMCEQLAWDHLRARLGVTPQHATEKRKVYLSYRKGPAARRGFVEGVAHRLGREGFDPWFDEWEIKAGDSIPRGIASGPENVYGIVAILTADFPDGRWAREELENAIAQRVERDIKIIPLRYEQCERLELLRSLRYVDCTIHEPDRFEAQFLQIIDALNEIDLNPYR